jgi:antitoxin (DNA-binding transcriptional repressor) of toxin-antitoxin stability system
MRITVSLAEAERDLAALVARAEGGDEVVIERDGQPVARLCAPSGAALPGKKRPRDLLEMLDEVHKRAGPISQEEADDIVEEVMQSVRPGFRLYRE